MPPKQKKQEAKIKQKIVEDRTNKNKSAKVKSYVEMVEKNVMGGGNRKDKAMEEAAKREKELRKMEEERRKEELSLLFKPVQAVQKVPFGVDPKTILCAFFKAGQCTKGDKCKFSHDTKVERKSEKIDLYTDARENKNETMENWDQATLEKVVKSKSGEVEGAPRKTDIVCKHFLDAIEKKLYGFFWECPNGGSKCQYRHALPPGFVLKSEKQKEEGQETITLEEFLETERQKLGSNLTPLTLETFKQWKENRAKRKLEEEAEALKKKQAEFKAGKGNVSGRELFTFNPDLFVDDDDAMGEEGYERDEEEEEQQQQEEESEAPLYDVNAVKDADAEAESKGKGVSYEAESPEPHNDQNGDVNVEDIEGDEDNDNNNDNDEEEEEDEEEEDEEEEEGEEETNAGEGSSSRA